MMRIDAADGFGAKRSRAVPPVHLERLCLDLSQDLIDPGTPLLGTKMLHVGQGSEMQLFLGGEIGLGDVLALLASGIELGAVDPDAADRQLEVPGSYGGMRPQAHRPSRISVILP